MLSGKWTGLGVGAHAKDAEFYLCSGIDEIVGAQEVRASWFGLGRTRCRRCGEPADPAHLPGWVVHDTDASSGGAMVALSGDWRVLAPLPSTGIPNEPYPISTSDIEHIIAEGAFTIQRDHQELVLPSRQIHWFPHGTLLTASLHAGRSLHTGIWTVTASGLEYFGSNTFIYDRTPYWRRRKAVEDILNNRYWDSPPRDDPFLLACRAKAEIASINAYVMELPDRLDSPTIRKRLGELQGALERHMLAFSKQITLFTLASDRETLRDERARLNELLQEADQAGDLKTRDEVKQRLEAIHRRRN